MLTRIFGVAIASLMEAVVAYKLIHLMRVTGDLESIQGTCRLSLKMGSGDEQKPVMHCIRQ